MKLKNAILLILHNRNRYEGTGQQASHYNFVIPSETGILDPQQRAFRTALTLMTSFTQNSCCVEMTDWESSNAKEIWHKNRCRKRCLIDSIRWFCNNYGWKEEIFIDIGKRLKDARLKMNFTQEQVAERLSVSRQTISNWENEKTYPDIVRVIELSTFTPSP